MSDRSDDKTEWVRRVLGVVIPGQTAGADPAGPMDGLGGQWNRIRADLEAKVMAALKADHPEATKIRALWGFAEDKGRQGSDLDAVQAGSRLETLLAGGAGLSPIPAGTVAFQRSRLMWIASKQEMEKGLGTFRDAVVGLANDDVDKDEILATVDTLVGEFKVFDSRLEDQLDAVAKTPEGDDRKTLKAAAKKTVDDYIKTLGGPFFSRVDKNPFVAVNVTARGQQCLSSISAALS